MIHSYYSRQLIRLSVLVIGLASITFKGNSQNLVINPSFEDVNIPSLNCSWYTSQAQFNNAINNWTCPTGGSTDIFNTALATTCYCSPFSTNASSPGTQAPLTGNGFVNIVTYGNGGCDPWREYVQGELTSAMVVGQTYEVEMWVTLADKMAVGTNNIGVKFSTDPYNQASNCGYYTTPDLNYTGAPIMDKDNWVQILFCYTPTVAGLDNFIIGNFYNDAATTTAAASGVTTGNTIRYFVEDVRVELATGSGNAGLDGTIGVCSGATTTDLFASLGGTPDMTGTWSGPSALVGGYLGTYDPAINGPGVYTYDVAGGGFCGGGAPASATVTVTVNPSPAVSASGAGPYCVGDPISINESGGAATTWSWTSNGLATITNPTDQNPTVTGATNGEIFTVVVDDGSGCTNTDQFAMVVNALPTVTANDNGPYCAGDPMSVSEIGGEGTTWSWSSNGGATITPLTGQNPTVTGAVDGEIFTVTATDVNGCVNTSQATYTINPLPTVTASNTGPYCAGNPMSINETGGNSTTWSWSSNGGATITPASGQNPAITGATNGEMFTVTGTDALGCVNTSQTTLIVNPSPAVNAPNPGSVCIGTGFSATEIGGDATGWTWSSNGASTITNVNDQNPNITGAVDGEIFTVVVTDGSGCSSTAQFTMTVNALPVITANDNGPYCEGDAMTLSETGGQGTTWSWSSNGGATITPATGQNPSVTGAVNGEIFTVTGTDVNGCVSSDQATYVINALPTVVASNTGPICADVISLNVNETGGSSTSWMWTSDMGATITNNTDVNPVITGASTGETFTVTGTDANGCVNTSQTTVVVNALPTVSPTNDGPICAGTTLTLDEIGGTGTGWAWSTGGGSTINTNNTQSTTVTGAVDGEVFTVIVTDANGCVNTNTTTVSVIALPALDPIADTIVCDNFVLLGITGTNLSGNEAYYNDSQVNGGTAISGTLNTTQTVYLFDGNGSCSDETSFVVTVNPLPTGTNFTGGGTYCQGDQIPSITLDVTGSANWTIDYTLDGTPLTITQGTNPIDFGNAPGVYVITDVTDANCTNTASGTQTILVNPSPIAPTAGVDSTYCDGDVLMDLNAVGSGGNLNWYSDAGLTNNIGSGGAFTPANQTGTSMYYVTETVNGCTGPASVVMITINDCSVPVVITIPTAITPDGNAINDSWEIVNIDTAYPDNSVYVFNRWGNILFEHNSVKDGPYDQNRWDGTFKGETLPVGSYFYLIEYNDAEGGTTSGAVSILQ